MPGLKKAKFGECRAELGREITKGEQVDEIEDVLPVYQIAALPIHLATRKQGVHGLAGREFGIVEALIRLVLVRIIEFIRTAQRAPLRLDARFGRLDAALGPAKLGAFVGARNENVDDVMGEDEAQDLKADFEGEGEEWAILGDIVLSTNWARVAWLDVFSDGAFLCPF